MVSFTWWKAFKVFSKQLEQCTMALNCERECNFFFFLLLLKTFKRFFFSVVYKDI